MAFRIGLAWCSMKFTIFFVDVEWQEDARNTIIIFIVLMYPVCVFLSEFPGILMDWSKQVIEKILLIRINVFLCRRYLLFFFYWIAIGSRIDCRSV